MADPVFSVGRSGRGRGDGATRPSRTAYRAYRRSRLHPANVVGILGIDGIYAHRRNNRRYDTHHRFPTGTLFHLVQDRAPKETKSAVHSGHLPTFGLAKENQP